MSGAGHAALDRLAGSELKVAVVAGRWHPEVMDGLLAGAQRALSDAGVQACVVVRVPGSFELPIMCQFFARLAYDAVVALGVVVRGGTPHFDYVCSAVTGGLTRVALDEGVPVGFGVLTCDDDQQALDRAGLPASREDKGYEATHAAMSTALTLRGCRRQPH